MRARATAVLLIAAGLSLAGCGLVAPTASRPSPAPAVRLSAQHGGGAGLVYSHASAQVVQPQPASGSCHIRGRGQTALPDPRCTPGALNPAVTQATIHRTICVPGWTASVRPPESVTEREKVASMAAYGERGSLHAYEYDHLVSLELGGAVNDPRNLWPEPGASPNAKDRVEDRLHAEVCTGTVTLARAQREIASDWLALVPASTSLSLTSR